MDLLLGCERDRLSGGGEALTAAAATAAATAATAATAAAPPGYDVRPSPTMAARRSSGPPPYACL